MNICHSCGKPLCPKCFGCKNPACQSFDCDCGCGIAYSHEAQDIIPDADDGR